ncbi:hypothetical protein SAMN05421812_10435 [Asanoa hainanensis]|uniref:DUF3558 domain-containing protein n=1 Tax=Asanoa hainanensis TaxID=560556 RepID=A0A239L6A8_9ACTN|nr:hypothetical protein [Asanoa hainanensis]SNT25373.1 hypothetical protein SAMN05421812_10435 [Asanoa hainanensis]
MRRVVVSLLLVGALLAPAGCGSSGDGGETSPAADSAVADEGGAAGAMSTTVPGCPFTAAQVTELVGQPMNDEGNCLFGDGKGVASLTVTVSSALAGETTYDYQRETAGKSFPKVSDLGKGKKSYLAVKDIQAEAALISDQGAYTLIMSSFGFDEAKYDQTMNALIDVILG